MKKLSDIAPLSEKHHSEKPPVKKPAGSHKQPSLLKDRAVAKLAKHRRWIIIASILAVGIVTAFVIYHFVSGTTDFKGAGVKHPDQADQATKYYSPLTGREVSNQAATKRSVLAVMIENSPEARPQSGLKDAGVVFEAVAEGGITRFIALYQDNEPSLIGPVRSVRPYYLDWAAAFSPAVAHVGGSPEALNMLRSGSYGVDLDQFANGAAYWRAKDRRAPHNVYTDYSHLAGLASNKGKTSSDFSGLTRQAVDSTAKTDGEAATTIKLAVSTGQFAVSYAYDTDSHTYLRYQGNVAHQDREKGQVTPDVVIALQVNQTLQSDRLHNTIATIGSGGCYVFQDGTVTKGTWHKDSPTSQLTLLDEAGQPIQLKRGQTWITAVANGKAITWE